MEHRNDDVDENIDSLSVISGTTSGSSPILFSMLHRNTDQMFSFTRCKETELSPQIPSQSISSIAACRPVEQSQSGREYEGISTKHPVAHYKSNQLQLSTSKSMPSISLLSHGDFTVSKQALKRSCQNISERPLIFYTSRNLSCANYELLKTSEQNESTWNKSVYAAGNSHIQTCENLGEDSQEHMTSDERNISLVKDCLEPIKAIQSHGLKLQIGHLRSTENKKNENMDESSGIEVVDDSRIKHDYNVPGGDTVSESQLINMGDSQRDLFDSQTDKDVILTSEPSFKTQNGLQTADELTHRIQPAASFITEEIHNTSFGSNVGNGGVKSGNDNDLSDNHSVASDSTIPPTLPVKLIPLRSQTQRASSVRVHVNSSEIGKGPGSSDNRSTPSLSKGNSIIPGAASSQWKDDYIIHRPGTYVARGENMSTLEFTGSREKTFSLAGNAAGRSDTRLTSSSNNCNSFMCGANKSHEKENYTIPKLGSSVEKSDNASKLESVMSGADNLFGKSDYIIPRPGISAVAKGDNISQLGLTGRKEPIPSAVSSKRDTDIVSYLFSQESHASSCILIDKNPSEDKGRDISGKILPLLSSGSPHKDSQTVSQDLFPPSHESTQCCSFPNQQAMQRTNLCETNKFVPVQKVKTSPAHNKAEGLKDNVHLSEQDVRHLKQQRPPLHGSSGTEEMLQVNKEGSHEAVTKRKLTNFENLRTHEAEPAPWLTAGNCMSNDNPSKCQEGKAIQECSQVSTDSSETIPPQKLTQSSQAQSCENTRKWRGTMMEKAHAKELQSLHRLVDLYNNILGKLDRGIALDGKSQLQRFEQIVVRLSKSLEAERKDIFPSQQKEGSSGSNHRKGNRKMRLKQLQERHAVLLVALNKHEELRKRVLVVQVDKERLPSAVITLPSTTVEATAADPTASLYRNRGAENMNMALRQKEPTVSAGDHLCGDQNEHESSTLKHSLPAQNTPRSEIVRRENANSVSQPPLTYGASVAIDHTHSKTSMKEVEDQNYAVHHNSFSHSDKAIPTTSETYEKEKDVNKSCWLADSEIRVRGASQGCSVAGSAGRKCKAKFNPPSVKTISCFNSEEQLCYGNSQNENIVERTSLAHRKYSVYSDVRKNDPNVKTNDTYIHVLERENNSDHPDRGGISGFLELGSMSEMEQLSSACDHKVMKEGYTSDAGRGANVISVQHISPQETRRKTEENGITAEDKLANGTTLHNSQFSCPSSEPLVYKSIQDPVKTLSLIQCANIPEQVQCKNVPLSSMTTSVVNREHTSGSLLELPTLPNLATNRQHCADSKDTGINKTLCEGQHSEASFTYTQAMAQSSTSIPVNAIQSYNTASTSISLNELGQVKYVIVFPTPMMTKLQGDSAHTDIKSDQAKTMEPVKDVGGRSVNNSEPSIIGSSTAAVAFSNSKSLGSAVLNKLHPPEAEGPQDANFHNTNEGMRSSDDAHDHNMMLDFTKHVSAGTSSKAVMNKASTNARNHRPSSPCSTVSSSLFPVSSKEIVRRIENRFALQQQGPSKSDQVQLPENLAAESHVSNCGQSEAVTAQSTHTVAQESSDAVTSSQVSAGFATINCISPLHKSGVQRQALSKRQLQATLTTSEDHPSTQLFTRDTVEQTNTPEMNNYKETATAQASFQFGDKYSTKANTNSGRKRGRPKLDTSAHKNKKAAKGDPSHYIQQSGRIEQYFPKTQLPINQTSDSNRTAPDLPETVDSRCVAPTVIQDSQMTSVPHMCDNDSIDISAVINNLRTVELIADEEIGGADGDFPLSFWEENFSDITLSESFWNSLNVW